MTAYGYNNHANPYVRKTKAIIGENRINPTKPLISISIIRPPQRSLDYLLPLR